MTDENDNELLQKIEKLMSFIIRFEIICLKISLTLGVISALTDFVNICFFRYDFPPASRLASHLSVVSPHGIAGAAGPSTTIAGLSETVTVRADGNYTPGVTSAGTTSAPSPSDYGKWVKANMRFQSGDDIRINISGQISLCRAYLPKYHLQVRNSSMPGSHSGAEYHTVSSGDKVPIPRIGESGYLTLLMDPSNVKGWRNLTQLYKHDRYFVIVDDNLSPGVTRPQAAVTASSCNALTDSTERANCNAALQRLSLGSCSAITETAARDACVARSNRYSTLTDTECNNPTPDLVDLCVIRSATNARNAQAQPIAVNSITVRESVGQSDITGDCSENRTTYSPVCGRYSLWNGTNGQYVSDCSCRKHHGFCGRYSRCRSFTISGQCAAGMRRWYTHNCSRATYSNPPRPYLDDGSRTQARFTNSNMFNDFPDVSTCETSRSACSAWTNADIRDRFWFSARDVAGLQYKLNGSIHPGTSTAAGSTVNWASLIASGSDIFADRDSPRKIFSGEHGGNIQYYQLRLHGVDIANTSPTGGYVVRLKHTKCFRENGNKVSDVNHDPYIDRGEVQYLLLPRGDNPNNTPSLAASPTGLSSGSQNITAGGDGYLWFRIKNDQNDYMDSSGTYTITLEGPSHTASFTLEIMNPIIALIKNKVLSIGEQIFSNMICYRTTPTTPCINFFNYIRGMLTIYIIFLGFRFLMGSEIKQDELVKSLLKVVIVGGLINGSTFEFFGAYILPLVRSFSDEILANMSGFSMLAQTNTISNPFGFLETLFTKVFMSPAFVFQILSILTMHIAGIFYFLVVVIAVIIFITAAFRAIAVYVMSLLATTLLIGLGPMFISFMLFERTYTLFQYWLKFTFRYMMEPIIVLAGIIVLTQLFTIYLDQVISYSVCWKCALPFKIPFASLLPFPGLQDIPLFCIYWFSPWGLSPTNDPMGMDIAMIVGLVIVSYTAYGYVNFAETISINLVGTEGGASAISLGQAMSSHMIQSQLKAHGLDRKSLNEAKAKLKDSIKKSKDAKANHEAKGLGGGRGANPTDAAVGRGSQGGTSTGGLSGGGGGSTGGGSSGTVSTPKMGGGAKKVGGAVTSAIGSILTSASDTAASTAAETASDQSIRGSNAPPGAGGSDADSSDAKGDNKGDNKTGDDQASDKSGAAQAQRNDQNPKDPQKVDQQQQQTKTGVDQAPTEGGEKAPEEQDGKAAATPDSSGTVPKDDATSSAPQDPTNDSLGTTPVTPDPSSVTPDAGGGDDPSSGQNQGRGVDDSAAPADKPAAEMSKDNLEAAKELGLSPEKASKLQNMSPEELDRLKALDPGQLSQELGIEDFRDQKRAQEMKEFIDRIKNSPNTPGAGR